MTEIVQRILRTDEDYGAALEEFERLLSLDLIPGSEDDERFDLLSVLIENYESENFKIDIPDPIEAIEFVLEQNGLSRKDLVPLIGSASKVSEVMARKRPLSLPMIKAIHKRFEIPFEVLLSERPSEGVDTKNLDFEKFPIKEMAKKNWFDADIPDVLKRPKDFLVELFGGSGGIENNFAFLRQTHPVRVGREMNPYALEAWKAKVLLNATHALESGQIGKYSTDILSREFFAELATLSRLDEGPLAAQQLLADSGVVLSTVPHLSKTYLDGAALLHCSGHPVIGMTLRYDRLDNFWFVLFHELAHVKKHLIGDTSAIIDDLDVKDQLDPIEVEADNIANEALIPSEVWESSGAAHLNSAYEAISLANQLNIHPAIVAGRIRNSTKNYKKLGQLVGNGVVRDMFWG